MEKITILALHLGYGGVEKAIASLSNILISRYDVEIISVYKLYDEPAFDIDKRVKITYLLDSSLSPNKEELKQAIQSKNILRIIKEGYKSSKILVLKKSKMIDAIKTIKEGVVISTRLEHNKFLSKYGNKNLVKIAQEHAHHNDNEKYINRLIESCENIDYFIPVSQQLTDFYKQYLQNTKTRCIFIPHSLDHIPESTSKLKEHNIISVGRLSAEKGFLDLLDVFKLVVKEKGNCILNIIGDGVEKEIIKTKIKEYNLENNVFLHGYRSKDYIDMQLLRSSAYVMASHEESFGLVLIEAQSFGIPCIAFDSAKGATEIIADSRNGYLIKGRSKEEMARRIIDLIDNEDIRQSMGYESRINSLKYSKENVSRVWFEFLKNI